MTNKELLRCIALLMHRLDAYRLGLSDLSEEDWHTLEDLVEWYKTVGRRIAQDRQDIFNASIY